MKISTNLLMVENQSMEKNTFFYFYLHDFAVFSLFFSKSKTTQKTKFCFSEENESNAFNIYQVEYIFIFILYTVHIFSIKVNRKKFFPFFYFWYIYLKNSIRDRNKRYSMKIKRRICSIGLIVDYKLWEFYRGNFKDDIIAYNRLLNSINLIIEMVNRFIMIKYNCL